MGSILKQKTPLELKNFPEASNDSESESESSREHSEDNNNN